MALLRQRNVVPEEMDRPDLPAALHEQALRGLARLNWWSGSDRILWPSIHRLAIEIYPRLLRVLDVACGAGDVLVGLARRAERAGVTLELAGIDLSATAIKHTRQRTTAAGLSVKLEQRDALGEALSDGFDVVTCSLFLHHLRSDQAVELLRRMSAATTRLVLVNDLRRSAGAWLLASAACRLLSRSPIVHIDGPRSVSAAFNLAEASELVEKAGLIGAVVARRWPFRYLLAWDRATT